MVRKGQTYSMDLIIGAVIFILLVVIFLALMLVNRSQDYDLRAQVDFLFDGFDSQSSTPSSIKLFQGSSVDSAQVQALFESNYTELKQELGIRDDFCIMFIDSSGGLMGFEVDNQTKYSFGHPSIMVSENLRCGDWTW